MSRKRWIEALALLLLALAAGVWLLWPRPSETAVRVLPLGGEELADAELSSLAWYRDTLVLLPQYPARFPSAEGAPCLLTLTRSEIEATLDGERAGPLMLRRVPLIAPDLEARIPGFDGLEAIVFVGDHVYLAVESRRDEEGTVGWLVRGRVEGALARVVLDTEHPVRLRAQNELENVGYEALTVRGGRLIALYETNGQVNPRPTAHVFDLALRPHADLHMAPLEYRVTDATEVDAEGRFFVTNYHWPGSPWETAECALVDTHGQGESHARCATVERLVEMEVRGDRLAPTARPPIQLSLLDPDRPRNWEGVVRLGDRGFLLVTDEYPETILAFVAVDDL